MAANNPRVTVPNPINGGTQTLRASASALEPSNESTIKQGISRLIVRRSKLASASSVSQSTRRMIHPANTTKNTGATARNTVSNSCTGRA